MATDVGRSGADAPSGHSAEPEPISVVSAADAASVPNANELACPSCGEHLHLDAEAVLPAQTDITLTLHIEAGQLCMAKTIAGVIDNFVDLQVAVAKSLDCEVSVFMAGLKYEDDVIYLTFRMANTAKGRTAEQVEMFA